MSSMFSGTWKTILMGNDFNEYLSKGETGCKVLCISPLPPKMSPIQPYCFFYLLFSFCLWASQFDTKLFANLSNRLQGMTAMLELDDIWFCIVCCLVTLHKILPPFRIRPVRQLLCMTLRILGDIMWWQLLKYRGQLPAGARAALTPRHLWLPC